jgi:thiosulfate reductase cytochrome b subunit
MTDGVPPAAPAPRHARFVRITHWLTVVAVVALVVSGVELVLSHPRFYWGETGNVNMTPLFSFPVPSSRGTVPTGYSFVLADQNGWSRSLHFEAAWLALFVGLVYLVLGIRTGHFGRNLVPAAADRTWRALRASIAEHARLTAAALGDPWSYNALQRLSYLGIVFVLFPLVVWTGLALAPGFTAVFPFAVDLLGGRQSARTLHLLAMFTLVLFTVVHVAMIIIAGFRARVGAMITGGAEEPR